MPDITMCEGTGCPAKDNCYRHTAKPSEYRQSYFVNPPYNKQENKCDHYWGEDAQSVFNQLQDIVNSKT
jgi:hypothetical protein